MSGSSSRVPAALWKLLVNGILPSPFVSRRVRRDSLRLLGVRITRPAEIRYGFDLLTPQLTVGGGAFINRNVSINNTAPVTLEENVALGPNVLITTTHHRMGSPDRRQGIPEPLPVRIGRGTWIGARAVVLPGVTIGAGCVIAAGAVVSRDCAPHGLYAGVPARRLRDLDSGEYPARLTEGSAETA